MICQSAYASPEAKDLYKECLDAEFHANLHSRYVYFASCYSYFHGFVGRDGISVNDAPSNQDYFCLGDTSAREWVASFMSWFEKNQSYKGDAAGAVFRMFVEKYPCR